MPLAGTRSIRQAEQLTAISRLFPRQLSNASRLTTERSCDVRARRRSKLKGLRRNRRARFVAINGHDVIAVGLEHFRPLDLEIVVHLNREGFEQAFERRIARDKLKDVAVVGLACRDVVAVLDVLEIERGGQRRVLARECAVR